MITEIEFLNKYNLHNKFKKSGIIWDDMTVIYLDYQSKIKSFEKIAATYATKMMSFKSVHSVRYRIKDPEHLIEKIIRKSADKGEKISNSNYLDKITDIIGIRALHVFKNDFIELHEQIMESFGKDICENVHIKLRKGDDKEVYNPILKNDPKFEKNEAYRSIHYVINHNHKVKVEIQTRTVFEEGWSEVNHKILYKKENENDLQEFASKILSRLAGTCDDVSELMRKVDSKQNKKENITAKDLSLGSGDNAVDILKIFIKDY